jgi:hypothetical protein
MDMASPRALRGRRLVINTRLPGVRGEFLEKAIDLFLAGCVIQ